MEQNKFIELVKDGAIATQVSHNILASITIAQSILESGWGTSELFQKANNSFGIKWTKGCGFDKVQKSTKEVIDGKTKTVKAYFRKYNSLDESIKDHAEFLMKDRYKNIIGDTDYKSVARKLYEDGYSTSPEYPEKLIKIIEDYKLYEYDINNGGTSVRIGLRGGHSKNCVGAVGLIKEYETMQKLYYSLAAILAHNGHVVIDCNSNAASQGEELSEGVRIANDNNVDLFISLHMNAATGQGHGTEALVYSPKSGAYPLGERLTKAFERLGFTNRGVKIEPKMYELSNVYAPSIILETCFCDNNADVELFNDIGIDKIALAIANAIDAKISVSDGVQATQAIISSSANHNASIKALQGILNTMGICDRNGNKLIEDGFIGPLTLSALNHKAALVKRGDRSELVRWVQSKLNIPADGIYGTQTYNAICAFQKAQGLSLVDGIVGSQTWGALVK